MPAISGPAWTRTVIPLLAAPAVTGIADGAGALTLVDSLPMPYYATLERITFVSGSIATGAGGTQTYKVRKGGASGTVIGTLTLALADVNAVGKFKSATVAAADDESARFRDNDTISLTRDAGGTAFTKFEGVFYLTFRQRPQARI